MKITAQTKGTLAILFATMLWGMTFTFIKDAVSTISPFNFLFWRFGLASILLFVIFFKYIELKDKRLITHGVLLGLFLGGTVIFQTIGLQYIAASTASFITGLAVVLVTLFVCLLDKKWPTIYVSISVVLAIIGVGLITLSHGMTVNKGDLWVMLCAVCFAVYIILAGKFSQDGKPLTLTFIQFFTIFILTGCLDMVNHGVTVPTKIHVWVAILFCTIFASIIAFILQLRYQRYITSNKAAIIFATEPVFATITAAIVLHEKLTVQFIFGALLIFSAMLLSEKGMKKKVIPQD